VDVALSARLVRNTLPVLEIRAAAAGTLDVLIARRLGMAVVRSRDAAVARSQETSVARRLGAAVAAERALASCHTPREGFYLPYVCTRSSTQYRKESRQRPARTRRPED